MINTRNRNRSNIMLVANDIFNERFFWACQHVKIPRYMNQTVSIIAWRACRQDKLIAMEEVTKVDITGLVMTALKPPSFSDYVKAINGLDKPVLTDSDDLKISLTMEIAYQYRGK